MSVLLVLMLLALVYAFWQSRRATREADRANQEQLKKEPLYNAKEALRAGTNLARQKRYTEAIGEYDKSIQFDPDNSTAYSNKGYAYIRNNQPKEAIKILEDLTRKDATFVLGHYNLALAYKISGNADSAASEVDKVLELDKDTYCTTFKSDPSYKKWAPQTPQYQNRCAGVQ